MIILESGEMEEPVMRLPELPYELVLKILTQLSGKQLGRCKCVCKSWRSIIGSPPFLEAYRSRQPGLLLFLAEEIDSGAENGRKDLLIRFFHSTLQLQKPKEESSFLYELRIVGHSDQITHVVNGLTCVRGLQAQHWTLYNICTGQMMSFPAPPLDNSFSTPSTFHLGYDPGSGVYKLLSLRWIISNNHQGLDQHPLDAKIITLGSTTSVSSWRHLDNSETGIAELPRKNVHLQGSKTFPGDGVLYWLRPSCLISFDLNKEKFQSIKLPENFQRLTYRSGGLWSLAQSMGRLVLWSPLWIVDRHSSKRFVFLALEDEEGNKWSKHSVPLPEDLTGDSRSLIVVVGKLPTGEMLLMNSCLESERRNSRPVYSYDLLTNTLNRFFIGKLPIRSRRLSPDDFYNDIPSNVDGIYNKGFARRFHDFIFYLLDNNNFYLPLDDVLSGGLKLQ